MSRGGRALPFETGSKGVLLLVLIKREGAFCGSQTQALTSLMFRGVWFVTVFDLEPALMVARNKAFALSA